MDPVKYYNHREIIHKLYDQDVYYGDLCGELLGLREQNRFIDGMFIDMSNYTIVIDLIPEEDQKKVTDNYNKVLSKLSAIINGYIAAKIDKVTEPDIAADIINSLTSEASYDVFHIGTSMTINL